MRLIASVATIFAFARLALAAEEGIVLTKLQKLPSELAPEPTPAPVVEELKEKRKAGGTLTMHITNKLAGGGVSISYRPDSGSPIATPAPTPGLLKSETTITYPSGWAGVIFIGHDFNGDNSKIEASNSNGQPHADVSYIDAYSVPIVCMCGSYTGAVLTGCNYALFALHTCANQETGPLCKNPLFNSTQPQGSAASPFFDDCQGAAYTYPNDNLGDKGCDGETISCCVGSSSCPANPRQKPESKVRVRARGRGWLGVEGPRPKVLRDLI
ncbi:hypothetical protein MMC21_007200 [Puttea exsequens]|nr:hypothetical protein [Puttea exsequens]